MTIGTSASLNIMTIMHLLHGISQERWGVQALLSFRRISVTYYPTVCDAGLCRGLSTRVRPLSGWHRQALDNKVHPWLDSLALKPPPVENFDSISVQMMFQVLS